MGYFDDSHLVWWRVSVYWRVNQIFSWIPKCLNYNSCVEGPRIGVD